MENVFLPQLVIENFQCVLCGKHVFVAPITGTEDEESIKCGRCSSVKSDHPVRMEALEKLASFMTFPCTFKGCDATLRWGKVVDHERSCNYRLLQCPYGNCIDNYPINQIVSHFWKKHRNAICNNDYRLNESFGAHVYVNFHEQEPYVLLFYENNANIWISVYSVTANRDNMLFQIQFYGSSTAKSLIFQADVVPFNDQEHCLNCLHHLCSNDNHKYSKGYKNYDIINECMVFNIEKANLQTMMGSDIAYYTVKVAEHKIKKYIMDDRERALIKNLECPVCHGLMTAPIYSCWTGHSVCNACSGRISTCPLCSKQMTVSRCFALEGIAENIQLFCYNRKNGCAFSGNANQCIDHEKNCSLTPSPIKKINKPFMFV